ncbi:MAG TPA: hypothetical protein VFX59_02260 [Polyangiales bacterium]|nr:hypothetical protein [Polyangiales bacterium]
MSGSKSVAMLCVIAAAACGEGEDPARPGALLTDQETQSIIAANDIQSFNGSYTNCTNRTGSWSYPVAAVPSPAITNGLLSVIRGDTGCTLAITSIVSGMDGILTPNAPLALAASFGTARSFGMPIEFYATAAVGSVNFGGDFTISLLFSEQPRNETEGLTASFATVTGSTASAMGVAAPNYTIDVTGALVTTDVSKVIFAVSGDVVLTAGSNPGNFYVIVNNSVGNTYAAINTAYLGAGTPIAIATTIPASSFLAPGVNLTGNMTVRTLIIAQLTNGIASYQKFAITFSAPT